MSSPLRLVVYDRTDTALRPPTPGLSPVWWAGTWMHRLAGAADATFGASAWDEALTWALGIAKTRARRIGSLQVWGHGGWGFMRLGQTRLDDRALLANHALAPLLDGLRGELTGPDALVWLRCCSAFGTATGQRFAQATAQRLGCRVAGHTYIIGPWQSGTHAVRPGESPGWNVDEGVDRGPGGALRAKWSGPFEPGTVSFLRLGLPESA